MEKKQYPFIKEFMLISQTPMIHFQFEQNGATLRATEVKPKLDAFLTEKAKQIGVDISQWLIHDTKALNYKMRIIAEGASTSDCNIGNYKFYFGNMGESKKDVVFQNAKLQIICFLDELRDLICRTIKEFFILHNFGTRQSKGFGGFLIENTTNKDIDDVFSASKMERMEFYAYGTDVELFNHALTVYSVMKGGINAARFSPFNRDGDFDPEHGSYRNKNAYIKGFVQRAFLSENIGSDKAFVKSRVLRKCNVPNLKNNGLHSYRFLENAKVYGEYAFVRALLGLADHFEYRDDIHCIKKRAGYKNGFPYAMYYEKKIHVFNFDHISVDKNGQCIVSAEDIKNDTGIKRFKSPIQIKIFRCEEKGRVVFLFDDSFREILNKTFIFMDDDEKRKFDSYMKEKKYNDASDFLKKSVYIKVPAEFDREDFIRRFIIYFNANKETLKICGNPFRNSASLILKQGGK